MAMIHPTRYGSAGALYRSSRYLEEEADGGSSWQAISKLSEQIYVAESIVNIMMGVVETHETLILARKQEVGGLESVDLQDHVWYR